MSAKETACAKCSIKKRICRDPKGSGPDFCPTKNLSGLIAKIRPEYDRPEIAEFARQASLQEASGLLRSGVEPGVVLNIKPRVQETAELALRMGYKRLGLAFCIGFVKEARALTQVLEAQGFEVVSVACKVSRTPKEVLGIKEEEKVRPGSFEPMCNPILQAAVLNEAKCDFNIVFGLCVGHDSLFLKYSQALSTVLAVKDRVLGHNPLAALYNLEYYYARLLAPGFGMTGVAGAPRPGAKR